MNTVRAKRSAARGLPRIRLSRVSGSARMPPSDVDDLSELEDLVPA